LRPSRRWLHQPQTIWLRRALFQVHLWTGIGAGLYILAVGLSGSAVVFRPEIYKAYWQTPTVVIGSNGRLSDDELQAAAEAIYPGYSVTNVLSTKNPALGVEIWLERGGHQKRRFFHPYTGQDLGEAIPVIVKVFIELTDLHDNLMAGETGRKVNGVGGILLTILCATGIVIWWPGVRTWRRSLVLWRGTSWKRLNWSIHSAVGFWAFLLVLMWAISGAYLVFQEPFMKLVDVLEPFDETNLEPRFGDAILAWLARLHFGRFAGWSVKVLWVILGLVPPVLFVTGALMWWNRVLRVQLKPNATIARRSPESLWPKPVERFNAEDAEHAEVAENP
jgi:uncharacterized iron-regulated membrane protein